jgi:hypothetical protein
MSFSEWIPSVNTFQSAEQVLQLASSGEILVGFSARLFHCCLMAIYSDLLFTVGNRLINNPPIAPSKTLKRGRSPEVPQASLPAPLPSQATHQDFRNIAGSVRTSAAIQQQRSRDLADPPIYPLPISTEELGHLPVYQSFDLGDWGMSLESAFSDTGALLNFDPQQYSNNLQFTAMSAY